MSETIRTVKSNRFSIIDNQLLEDPTLSLQAKGLQAYLLSRPDGWTICPNHLATTCKGGVSQIRTTLKELEVARYIHREALRDDKGRISNWISWIYENPSLNPHPTRVFSTSGKTTSGKTTSGKTTSGKTTSGKSIHINTESSKTESSKTEKASTNTHNPERGREAAPVVKISEPEPELCQDPRISPLPAEELASTNNLSGKGEFSGGVVSQSTQNFQNRWSYSSDIAPITDEIIRLYNNGKPDNWTGIVGDSRRARRKIQDMALKYQGMGGKLAEIPEMMKKALLWYGGSDFHNKKEFGSGDIFWLCEQERVEIAAAKWAGSGESAKQKVATAILERENGIRHWVDGHVMSDFELRSERRALPKMRLDHPQLPPLEWVRKNLPEILDKLSSNYPECPQKIHAYN